jgi:hypothetical protein
MWESVLLRAAKTVLCRGCSKKPSSKAAGSRTTENEIRDLSGCSLRRLLKKALN